MESKKEEKTQRVKIQIWNFYRQNRATLFEDNVFVAAGSMATIFKKALLRAEVLNNKGVRFVVQDNFQSAKERIFATAEERDAP